MSLLIEDLLRGDDEYLKYLSSIQKKHFDSEYAIGSFFTEVKNLKQLFNLAKSQRGSLDGDDRKIFIEKHVPKEVFSNDCFYLYVKVKGKIGIIKAEELCDETPVYIIKAKPDIIKDGVTYVTPAKLCVVLEELPISNEATIIIGNNPTDILYKKIITTHPGFPVLPRKNDYWKVGEKVFVKDVIKHLGKNQFLNVILNKNKENVFFNTTYKNY